MFQQSRRRAWLCAALGVCAVVAAGCAGLPRIDPTGERVFIWPRNQVPAVAPAVGNLAAPPVFTDPVFPQPALATPGTILPPGAPPIPGISVPPVPQDTMSITPERVLAPVGSEVILKAGVCMPNQYFLTGTKIEWLIARESAGEFVSLGGRGYIRNALLPWNRPKKVDNQYAVGYSANVPLRITRGTAEVSDDVQVEPGEAWASITSPVEGVSNITAVAPEIEAWRGRRATATIYWVDVQWTFPPAAVNASGSQVLSTTVRRQTDGTPLEGWLVRYEVADGGALTGQNSGQAVEVTTDRSGRASIDVTPTGGAGSTSRINTQLVRPAGLGGVTSPRLVIANGTTTIQWSDGGTPYLPPADDLGATPSLPPINPIQPTPIQPTPAPPPVAGAPALELEIRSNDARVPVGGQARFEVVVRNRGNGVATGLVLNDSFDAGFSHLRDELGSREIRKTLAQSLAPGASLSDFINFGVVRRGTLCHDVTITCSEGAQAQKRACIEAVQPPTQQRAAMSVNKNGPRQKTVGETALFTLSVKNTGEVPLTNVEVIDEYDPALAPTPTQQGYRVINDRIVWSIPRIEIGQTKRLDVECRCLAPKQQACSTVQVSADSGTASGVISSAGKHCVEIVRAQNVVPPAGVVPGGPNVVPRGATGQLQLDLRSQSTATLRVGQIARYEVVVSHNATNSDEQLLLSVTFPPGLVPDVNSVRNDANVGATLEGNTLRFAPIAQIRPIERLTFNVQATVNQLSGGNVTAQLSSRRLVQPLQKSVPVEVIR